MVAFSSNKYCITTTFQKYFCISNVSCIVKSNSKEIGILKRNTMKRKRLWSNVQLSYCAIKRNSLWKLYQAKSRINRPQEKITYKRKWVAEIFFLLGDVLNTENSIETVKTYPSCSTIYFWIIKFYWYHSVIWRLIITFLILF